MCQMSLDTFGKLISILSSQRRHYFLQILAYVDLLYHSLNYLIMLAGNLP